MLASPLVSSPSTASTTSGGTSFGHNLYPVSAAASNSFMYGLPQSQPGSLNALTQQTQTAMQIPSWSQNVHQAACVTRPTHAPSAPSWQHIYNGSSNALQASAQQHLTHPNHWSQPRQAGPSSNVLQRTWQAHQQAPMHATPMLPPDFDPLASLLPEPEQGSGSSQQIDWNILQQAVGSASQQPSQQVLYAGLPMQRPQGHMSAQQHQFIARATLGSQNPTSFHNAAALGSLSTSLPQGSTTGQAWTSAPNPASLVQPPSGSRPGGVPILPAIGTQVDPENPPAPGLGPLTRALSAPAGEAFLSRAGDALKHLPDKVAITCGTARGTLLTKRARILHEGTIQGHIEAIRQLWIRCCWTLNDCLGVHSNAYASQAMF